VKIKLIILSHSESVETNHLREIMTATEKLMWQSSDRQTTLGMRKGLRQEH
jgi:hypothetical protein